jgi:flavin reductase (DIM6/NTAB) family NADH-FMN oxidoreductase RutF
MSTVVSRPIPLAPAFDGADRVDAAPFSFFNAVSPVPPVIVLGIQPRRHRRRRLQMCARDRAGSPIVFDPLRR